MAIEASSVRHTNGHYIITCSWHDNYIIGSLFKQACNFYIEISNMHVVRVLIKE